MSLTVALPHDTSAQPSRFSWPAPSRQIWWMLAIAAFVLLPRSFLINRYESERSDDEYHVRRGVQFLADGFANTKDLKLNDPPLGEALTVLPLWLAKCWQADGPGPGSALWNRRYSAEMILQIIGIWKSLLLLPMLAVAFIWIRGLFGLRSAWLAIGLLLVDPTIAGHTPLPTLDVLGMETIVIACFLTWRFFEKSTWLRLFAACASIAFALLVKHTAIVMPLVVVAFAFCAWVIKPLLDKQFDWKEHWRKRLAFLCAGALLLPLLMWVMLAFDYTQPNIILDDPPAFRHSHPILSTLMDHKLPGGLYLTSFFQAWRHSDGGHPAYLFGQFKRSGWWYYFPVVATYKIPIGMGLLLLLGLFSIIWRRLRWEELGLLIPMLVWTIFMMSSSIDIGWRHFLPPYAFMLMMASRFIYGTARGWLVAGWVALALAWGDTMRYYPDFLVYITWPRQNAWRDISDSNVDWGQGLRTVQVWAAKHAKQQRVYVYSYNWRPRMDYVRNRLGPKITIINPDQPKMPTSGIIVVSPVSLVGDYETNDPLHVLRKYKPMAVLGHALLVYDLDRLRHRKPFDWQITPTTKSATKPTTRIIRSSRNG